MKVSIIMLVIVLPILLALAKLYGISAEELLHQIQSGDPA